MPAARSRRVALVGKSDAPSSPTSLRRARAISARARLRSHDRARHRGERRANAATRAEIRRDRPRAPTSPIVVGGDGTMLAARARPGRARRAAGRASTWGAWASSPTSRLTTCGAAIGAILDGDFTLEERALLDGRDPARRQDAAAHARAQRRGREQRRAGQPDRVRGDGRRRVRLHAARRRPDRRDADRLDRVRALGAGADPASRRCRRSRWCRSRRTRSPAGR